MVNFHFPMVEIPFPDILFNSASETQGVDLFFFSILMFTSVQSLVSPQIFKFLDLFLSKAQK